MSIEAIKSIKDAEAQAEEIRKNAVQKARDIMRQAEGDGEEILQNALREVQEEGRILMEKARNEAEKEINTLKLENKNKIENIRQMAEGKLQEAVDFIMGRIVNSNGNR